MTSKLVNALAEHREVIDSVASQEQNSQQAIALMGQTFRAGGIVFSCGNGGSASDAQHFAAELTGRFEQDRPGYRAIALTTDTSALTAIGNDYGFERIFARQVESIGKQGDLLFVISTSGKSANLTEAVRQAKSQGIVCIGLLGRDGGDLAKITDLSIIVPGQRTSRIQEAHIFILHYLCDAFEPT